MSGPLQSRSRSNPSFQAHSLELACAILKDSDSRKLNQTNVQQSNQLLRSNCYTLTVNNFAFECLAKHNSRVEFPFETRPNIDLVHRYFLVVHGRPLLVLISTHARLPHIQLSWIGRLLKEIKTQTLQMHHSLWAKLLGTCELRNRDPNFNEIGTK